jgi:hypothetical protein
MLNFTEGIPSEDSAFEFSTKPRTTIPDPVRKYRACKFGIAALEQIHSSGKLCSSLHWL